jgi:putative nucleotidyltransferase with HDIG domain
VTDAAQRGRRRAAVSLAAAVLAGGALLAASDPGSLGESLTLVLLATAIAARLIVVNVPGFLFVSGAFLCGMLAAGFLGPAAAFLIPVASELVGWAVERYRRVALLVNLAGSATPTVAAAAVLQALDLDTGADSFPFVLAIAGFAVNVANLAIVSPLLALYDGRRVGAGLRPALGLFPAIALNTAIAAALAAVYVDTGLSVITLLLLVVVAFAYMGRLVIQARERAREYANLSWGVLSGLIRTLDARDHRAARHCAAVAKFARDIARHTGMSERDQELAHTAGLLHDIGRFALSDRVMERGVTLTEEDWHAIRRHPEIGADLLRDIGVYGPLSDIIVAHHERLDGKGYPGRLAGEDIPELAKVLAVAEVYDTLTAPDTYRTQLSSFEALTELRRVAGSQLDARYVEALAELLAGQGTEYRHADDADYDEELAIERRMNEAAAP